MKKFRGVYIKNEHEIGLLRIADGITAAILDELCARVRPGLSTMFFEELAQDLCRRYNVRPNFLGYAGYPFALCCSVNETVVHGFPSKERILSEGDIVSFDMGVEYRGFHGDSARTVMVGEVSDQVRKLCRVTEECLHLGIAKAIPGNYLYDISAAVQRHAEENGFKVIRRFVGHGIGAHLHEKPEVPNFIPAGDSGNIPLKAGMCLAIEPMIAIGTTETVTLSDGWTSNTADGSYAAHYEHSVVIGHNGPEILSLASNAPACTAGGN